VQEGENSTALASVPLGYVPWFRVRLSSRLTPEEIGNRIAARIVHRENWEGNLAFTGSTSLGAFEIRVRMPRGRDDGSVLLGTVEATLEGSDVSIRLRPQHEASFWIAGWTLFFVGIAITTFVEESQLFGVLVFGLGLLPWLRFWWRLRQQGRQLLQLVVAECEIALLPRPETPTTF
jgi:hypothetical protein